MATYNRGSSGQGVRDLQQALKNLGYNVDVDGIYGSNTANAVRQYQANNGLSADGIAGTQTLSKLYGGSSAKSTAQQLADYEAKKPSDYISNYQDEIDSILSSINSRPDFSYDFASDPLYEQYSKRYQQQGQLAMQDVIGEMAAQSGGYGNSYAQQVGQQTYQQYLQGLNDIIPELRDAAYQQYETEGANLRNDLSLYQGLDAQDYQRWADAYNQWQAERNYLYQKLMDEQAQANWERQFAASQSRGSGDGRDYDDSDDKTVEIEALDPRYNGYLLGLVHQVQMDVKKGKNALDSLERRWKNIGGMSYNQKMALRIEAKRRLGL